MKDLKNLKINPSSSACDIYNQLRTKSGSSDYEAQRTLEAIQKTIRYPLLTKTIRKEEESQNE